MLFLQDGETPPSMGTVQPILTEGSSRAGQTEPIHRHVVQGQCSSSRMETTPLSGSNDLVCLLEGRGGPLRLREKNRAVRDVF